MWFRNFILRDVLGVIGRGFFFLRRVGVVNFFFIAFGEARAVGLVVFWLHGAVI